MPTLELQKELIEKFQKKGELLVIWKCENCGRVIPFYKSGSDFIDTIYLCWAEDHKDCGSCFHKRIKQEEDRIVYLLKAYEEEKEEKWNLLGT